MKTLVVIVLQTLLLSSAVQAQTVIHSSEQPAQFIELYTSEGCSSCPPADRWLSKLKSHPELWTRIIPVAFHVDYWNYIGWEDRFSSSRYSARQRYYAANDNLNSVYTPGFLINGEEWRGFFKRQSLPKRHGSKGMGDLRIAIDDMHFDASFTPANSKLNEPLIINIAILGFDIETNVKAGENRNRVLQHDFVVLGYKALPFDRQQQHYASMDVLPDIKERSQRMAIAVWVSREGNPEPVQVAGGWLP